MKQYLFTVLVLQTLVATAQRDDQPALSHYIFDQFYQGKVYLKGGGTNAPLINYNALTNEMVFDNKGTILAIANPENVDSVVINNRVFVPVEDKFYEMLTYTPHPLYREFSCYIEQPGVSTGYGTKSVTTSATYIKGIYGPNAAYQTKLPEGLKVLAKQIWWIKASDGFHKFGNEQQLKKLFPEKKDQISEWVKKNHTSFSKPDDLASLVKQIDQ